MMPLILICDDIMSHSHPTFTFERLVQETMVINHKEHCTHPSLKIRVVILNFRWWADHQNSISHKLAGTHAWCMIHCSILQLTVNCPDACELSVGELLTSSDAREFAHIVRFK